MNKNIKLAVAGAVLALSASANAGIIIPAGEWTLDVNGNVNAFANYTHADNPSGTAATNTANGCTTSGYVCGGLASTPSSVSVGSENKQMGINTGLLPSWLGFTGTTRQNDVDVSFTMSMQPNVSDNNPAGDSNTPLWRQAFLTFGDKSWGTVKLGKDIGIFASDAILNDMTLLGVGAGAGNSGAATTLGGIGSGYIYAAWKGQVAYTTPNMNGFQATVGITNPNQIAGVTGNQDRYGVEGKASYSFAANDVTGKIWVSGASYDASVATVALQTGVATAASTTGVQYIAASAAQNYQVTAGDIGATVTAAGFTATGYYYAGKGAGTTLLGNLGYSSTYGRRDSDGGFVQLKYATPFKTTIGVAYGISNLDRANGEVTSTLVKENERWTIGAYHPLTKHLNLVAE
ncbi:MAG: porin, partial [Gammaproteobacteria bacterium]|nr:porin [Gammaproteobacteria bacterium]